MSGLIVDRHRLLINDDGEPQRDEEGNFHIVDTTDNTFYIASDSEEVRQFFGIPDATIPDHSPAVSMEASPNFRANKGNSATLPATSAVKSQQVTIKWKDENAVKALIKMRQDHESLFKSAAIKNSELWRMIAESLQKINPSWEFSSVQCENKFKDLRRNYTSTKDHNAQTGVQPKTCKFFDEMEEVLSTKPNVKPVAIASSLKTRSTVLQSQNPTAQLGKNFMEANGSSDSGDEEVKTDSKVEPARKKTRMSREIEAWALANQAEAQKKEEAREKRHRENMEKKERAIDIYEKFMSKLLDKL